ncbi:MAG: hypothetical protein JRH19_13135 [Deltaproteobacteria bacterium]|nr:hypothetical protein [Deltaproteobacteria bacterium]
MARRRRDLPLGRHDDDPDFRPLPYLRHNSLDNRKPAISGSKVVWAGGTRSSDTEIYLWDGESIKQVTENSYGDDDPDISGNWIVWIADDLDEEVMLARPPGELAALSGWMPLAAVGALGLVGFHLLSERSRRRPATSPTR